MKKGDHHTPETRAKIAAANRERTVFRNTREREHFKKLAARFAKRAVIAEQQLAKLKAERLIG